MIRLSYECETAEQLIEQLQLTLKALVQAVEAEPDANAGMGEPSPKPKKAAAKPKAEASPEKANGSGEATVPDEADLRKRATKFAAKNGPSALIQLQKDAGAPNGKISEIIGNEGRMDKLGELLAQAEF